MKYIFLVLLSCAILSFTCRDVAAAQTVVLSEIKTTGCKEYDVSDTSKCIADDGRQEFVELRNPAESSIDVSGWRLEYLSAGHSGSAEPTRLLAELSGELSSQSYAIFSFMDYVAQADGYFGTASSSGYLAKSGGHVRIVNQKGVTVDMVSWGAAKEFPGWPHAGEIASGLSAQRVLFGDAGYNEEIPFVIGQPHPEGGGLLAWQCKGAMLTEILPNPVGADTGQEYIEIHNPTNDTIYLDNCVIRLNESTTYTFGSATLQAGEYKTFSDKFLGFSLPNASGGTVWLIGAEEEQGTTYPANMPDGVSWAMINGDWTQTTSPTPSQKMCLVRNNRMEGRAVECRLPSPALLESTETLPRIVAEIR